jgi:DNA-binding beta-propeller fold protein YncE
VLPFTGLYVPVGVAVDAAGDVYVAETGNLAETGNSRVLKLAAGSATQSVLPFTGLNHPFGVAVDAAGDVYVADFDNSRVLKLAAGSATQSVLPFTDLNHPDGVAVDSAGNLYVTDTLNNRVLKLAAGSPERAAVHRPQRPPGCGGGHRRQPLRHRQSQQPSAETACGVMRRTAGARGCRASLTEAT